MAFTIEELKQILETTGISEDAANKILNAAKNIRSLGASAIDTADSIASMTGSFDNFLSNISKSISTVFSSFEKLKRFLTEDSFDSFGLRGTLMLERFAKILPRNVALFGDLGSAGADAGISISDSFSTATNVLEKFGATRWIADFINDTARSADQAQNLEQTLFMASAQAGQFSELLGAAGDDLRRGMFDQMAAYNRIIEDVSVSTGKLSTTTASWASQLLSIPGFLSKTIDVGGGAATTMRDLDAVMTVATGTGQSQRDVVEMMNFAYRQLGVTGKGAVEFLAEVGVAADEADVPLDIMRQSVTSIAESFKVFGDNTRAATVLMGDFSRAFAGSGLGPQAVAEMVQGITQGIERMDIARKAFISGASGGPGGLAGGFQLDLLLQQGKLDEVYARVEEAMKSRFGGPVLTLEQAAESPDLAGEFMKQVTFLKDVAGIASTDKEAYRILEAMKRGETAPMEEVKTGDEAIQTAIERGDKVQQSQMNEAIRLQNLALKEARIQSEIALQDLRTGLGTAGRGEIAASIEKRMMAGREAAAGEGIGEFRVEGGAAGAAGQRLATAPSAKDILEESKKFAKMIGSDLLTNSKILRAFMKNVYEPAHEELQEINTQIQKISTTGKQVPQELMDKRSKLMKSISFMDETMKKAREKRGVGLPEQGGVVEPPRLRPVGRPVVPGQTFAPRPVEANQERQTIRGAAAGQEEVFLNMKVTIDAEGVGKIADARARKALSEYFSRNPGAGAPR